MVSASKALLAVTAAAFVQASVGGGGGGGDPVTPAFPVPGGDEGYCVFPWDDARQDHVMSLPAGGKNFVPDVGFETTWTETAFILDGDMYDTSGTHRINILAEFRVPLTDAEKAECALGVKPCYKGSDTNVDNTIFYKELVGTIKAIDEFGIPYPPGAGPSWFEPGACNMVSKDFYPQVGLGANDKDGSFGGSAWWTCADDAWDKHADFNFDLVTGLCLCPDPEEPDPINPPIDPVIPVNPFFGPYMCVHNVDFDTEDNFFCRPQRSRFRKKFGFYVKDHPDFDDKHHIFEINEETSIAQITDSDGLLFTGDIVDYSNDYDVSFSLQFEDEIGLDECDLETNPIDNSVACPKYNQDQIDDFNVDDPEDGSAMDECRAQNGTNVWKFYSSVEGKLVALPTGGGDPIECLFSLRGGPGQVGFGANLHSRAFGASTWFTVEDSEVCQAIFGGIGDFNFELIVCEDPLNPLPPGPVCPDRYDVDDEDNGHFFWVKQSGARYVLGDVTSTLTPDCLSMEGTLVNSNDDTKALTFTAIYCGRVDYDTCISDFSEDYICGKAEDGSPDFSGYTAFYTTVTGTISGSADFNEDLDEWGPAQACTLTIPEGTPLPQLGYGANAKDIQDFGFAAWTFCEESTSDNKQPHWGDFNLVLKDCPDDFTPNPPACVDPPPFIPPTCDEDEDCKNCVLFEDGIEECSNKICNKATLDGNGQGICEKPTCVNSPDTKACGPRQYCDIVANKCVRKKRLGAECGNPLVAELLGETCFSENCDDTGVCRCDDHGDCRSNSRFCHTESGLCIRKKKVGANCFGDDAQCFSGECGDDSSKCLCTENAECPKNRFCNLDSGTCEWPTAVGESCVHPSMCKSGICNCEPNPLNPDGRCNAASVCECENSSDCTSRRICVTDKDYEPNLCKLPYWKPCSDKDECVSGMCHPLKARCQCKEDQECNNEAGMICDVEEDSRTFGMCVKRTCSSNNDKRCPKGEYCLDGECQATKLYFAKCQDGDECLSGYCIQMGNNPNIKRCTCTGEGACNNGAFIEEECIEYESDEEAKEDFGVDYWRQVAGKCQQPNCANKEGDECDETQFCSPKTLYCEPLLKPGAKCMNFLTGDAEAEPMGSDCQSGECSNLNHRCTCNDNAQCGDDKICYNEACVRPRCGMSDNPDAECGDSKFCMIPNGNVYKSRCVNRKPAGKPCRSDDQCKQTLVCHGIVGDAAGFCSCKGDGDCPHDRFCGNNGKCMKRRWANRNCAEDRTCPECVDVPDINDNICREGLICYMGKCNYPVLP